MREWGTSAWTTAESAKPRTSAHHTSQPIWKAFHRPSPILSRTTIRGDYADEPGDNDESLDGLLVFFHLRRRDFSVSFSRPSRRRRLTVRLGLPVTVVCVVLTAAIVELGDFDDSGHASSRATTPSPASTKATTTQRTSRAYQAPPPGPAQTLLHLPPIRKGPLPGYLMIADRNNNRILLVSPQKKIVWRFPGPHGPGASFSEPDDAFFTPGYRRIITNEEFN